MAVLVVASVLFGARTVANSDVASVAVTAVAGDLVGSDLINKVKQAASQLIDQGTGSGNALLINFGNQLDLSALDASMAMGAEANKAYKNMSVDAKNVTLSLSQLNDQIAALKGVPNNLVRAFFLDLREFTAGLTGEYFYIQQIDGITQLKKESGDAYHVKIFGVGLGPASSKIKSTVGMKINGAAVTALADQTHDGIAVVPIPRAVLDPLFKDKKVIAVPSSFEIDQDVSKHYARWKVWKWGQSEWHKAHYTVPFQLALVSSYAGHVKIITTLPTLGWVPSHREQVTLPTPDYDCHHNGSDCHHPAHYRNDITIKVPSSGHTPTQPGDQRLVSVSCVCISTFCPWSCADGCPVDIVENTTRAICHVDAWGGPVSFVLGGEAQVWQQTSTTSTQEQEAEVYYDKDLSFHVSSAEMLTTIEGVAPDGHAFNAVAGSHDIEGFMTARSTLISGDLKTYVYSVPRPGGVD